MENKKAKLKKWYEENKNDIKENVIRFAWCSFTACVSYNIGKGISDYKTGLGIERAYNKGIIKFFDPLTKLEVDPYEAIDVMKRTM